MKYRLTALFILLLLVLSLTACDSATAKETAPVEKAVPDNSVLVNEGFSYEGSSILRLYGGKDEDMALRVTTLFMSTSPECAGMYVLDEPNPSENSMSKPGAGPAGKYYQTRIAFDRENRYEIQVPMQLKHPQCKWNLRSMDFYIGNDFNWGTARVSRGGFGLMDYHFKYLHELDKHPELKKSFGLYLEEFMSVVKVHCYNHIAKSGRPLLQSYFEGQKGTASRVMMPIESTAVSADVRMDLHIEATIDSTKGEELPDVPEFAFGSRRK